MELHNEHFIARWLTASNRRPIFRRPMTRHNCCRAPDACKGTAHAWPTSCRHASRGRHYDLYFVWSTVIRPNYCRAPFAEAISEHRMFRWISMIDWCRVVSAESLMRAVTSGLIRPFLSLIEFNWCTYIGLLILDYNVDSLHTRVFARAPTTSWVNRWCGCSKEHI